MPPCDVSIFMSGRLGSGRVPRGPTPTPDTPTNSIRGGYSPDGTSGHRPGFNVSRRADLLPAHYRADARLGFPRLCIIKPATMLTPHSLGGRNGTAELRGPRKAGRADSIRPVRVTRRKKHPPYSARNIPRPPSYPDLHSGRFIPVIEGVTPARKCPRGSQ